MRWSEDNTNSLLNLSAAAAFTFASLSADRMQRLEEEGKVSLGLPAFLFGLLFFPPICHMQHNDPFAITSGIVFGIVGAILAAKRNKKLKAERAAANQD